MGFPRASGILLHPTSLPGRFGVGDFGDAAFKFVDFLAGAGQSYWQILPLTPTGYGDSPYSSYSAFAGNTLLISPGRLAADALISRETIENAPHSASEWADYGLAYNLKRAILAEAYETFQSDSDSPLTNEFLHFCADNSWWLDDYAAFHALRASNDFRPWFEWDERLRSRNVDALREARSELSHEFETERFAQYLFHRQWHALRNYANDNGVKLIGDIPIFVALDSADVWCNQDKFKLHTDGRPKVMAGVPPDYFSSTGQLWGNPIYDWDAMRRDGFGWWTARVDYALKAVDIVRLDHFIGFVRNWEVPGGDKTAKNGRWVDVPGRELFAVLRERLGDLPVIAEDLGAMTPEVEAVRDDFGFPGMRILQYAFGGDAGNRDLPHNYVRNSVVYTGTHDNDTTSGWYKKAGKNARNHCRTYLSSNGRDMSWDMIRAAFGSIADTAIIPAQDLLGLGSKARMNTPATCGQNWAWRLVEGQLDDGLAARLRGMSELYGRAR